MLHAVSELSQTHEVYMDVKGFNLDQKQRDRRTFGPNRGGLHSHDVPGGANERILRQPMEACVITDSDPITPALE
jgi:hypothetical protein